jgi:hypothetical protein
MRRQNSLILRINRYPSSIAPKAFQVLILSPVCQFPKLSEVRQRRCGDVRTSESGPQLAVRRS